MAQGHLERLSGLDVSFLTNEKDGSHMHVGGVLVFEGPAPSYQEFVEHIESRLPLVPRFRQRLAYPPMGMGRPFWIDDPNFNIRYHVRHTALPDPGSASQLRALTSRLFSQRLDRSKPLWEMYLVVGPDKKRFALINKTHHALIDGVSGVDIATVLLDLNPVPPEPADDDWVPSPEPSQADLAAESIKDAAEAPFELAGRGLGALTDPSRAISKASEVAEGLAEVAWNLTSPPPDVPLNVPIGSHRRFAWARFQLEDFKRIKNAFGGTVNDVVLAVVSGALRRWLEVRGIRPEGLELSALVPVSIRHEDQHGDLGNKLAGMRGPLPVYAEDPIRRLEIVREAMEGLKESKQALGAEAISRFNDFAPPTILAQAGRINFTTRLFNMIVTNVPGPQIPIYLMGREMQEIFPVAFLPEKHALAIAIMSYNGHVNFGLLADYDSMADVDLISEYLIMALGELLEAADQAGKAKPTETSEVPA